MARSPDFKHDLALLFAVLVWGVNFVVLKATLVVMPPHVLNVFRFVVSAVVLGALYVQAQHRSGASLTGPVRAHGWALFGMGLLGFLFYQLCFIVGIDHTTAGNGALIMASAPLWTAVIGHVFGFDFLRRGAWLGLLATFAGATVIVVGSAKALDFSNDTFFGNVLMMLAAVLWGAYTAFNKPMSRHVTPVGISFLGLLFALPFLIGIGAPSLSAVTWEGVGWWVWVAILFSGGLSTGVAVAIWNTAVKVVGPSQTAVYGNLVPLVALLSGVLFLHESVTLPQLAGGALIVGGLFVMRQYRVPRPVEAG